MFDCKMREMRALVCISMYGAIECYLLFMELGLWSSLPPPPLPSPSSFSRVPPKTILNHMCLALRRKTVFQPVGNTFHCVWFGSRFASSQQDRVFFNTGGFLGTKSSAGYLGEKFFILFYCLRQRNGTLFHLLLSACSGSAVFSVFVAALQGGARRQVSTSLCSSSRLTRAWG